MFNTLTDVTGVKVGHYTDREAATGCTVILCEQGAIGQAETLAGIPAAKEVV
jgi:L-aminopeptidase/D-esterase-like protein